MNMLKITRLEPCRAASFHVSNSFKPEQEAAAMFQAWAKAHGLIDKYRFLSVLEFNNPWGPDDKPRGYEIWCFLTGLDDVNLSDVIVKDFPGGLYAVTTVAGLDKIIDGIEFLHKQLKGHPRYEPDYPKGYRHGLDPVPEFEMVYTPEARRAEDFILDYFIPHFRDNLFPTNLQALFFISIYAGLNAVKTPRRCTPSG